MELIGAYSRTTLNGTICKQFMQYMVRYQQDVLAAQSLILHLLMKAYMWLPCSVCLTVCYT